MRLVLIALALAVAAAPAAADPAARAKAAARFKQGQEFFKAGDYDHAIVEYQAALALSDEPLLIFNVALCHDRAKRPEQALAEFKRYLERSPTGPVADEARESVARLTRIVDAARAERAADDARKLEAEQRRAAEQAAIERERTELERRRAALAISEQRAARLASRARIERYAALAAAVVGTGALAIGAKYGLDARADAGAITGHTGPWTDELLARDAHGRTAETRMIVLTTAGATAAIGAGVLYLLARRDDRAAARVRVEPGAVAIRF